MHFSNRLSAIDRYQLILSFIKSHNRQSPFSVNPKSPFYSQECIVMSLRYFSRAKRTLASQFDLPSQNQISAAIFANGSFGKPFDTFFVRDLNQDDQINLSPDFFKLS